MQYVTEDYRQEMRSPFRGASSVYAYIGLINHDAQRSARITSSFSGSESHLYDNSCASTVASTESDGSMTFTFGDFYELNIAGLTIDFVIIPSSITVTNGTKTETYSVDGVSHFTFDDGYTNCHYLKVTPNNGALRINNIQFGIGLQFSNKQIINTSRSNIVDHISSDLPQKRFNITVNNRSNEFSKDNPYGHADFIEPKQEVIYEYGRELADGSLYKIKGGKVLLNDWASDDYEASFACVGRLDYLDGEFYKGQVYENGISAYDLAEFVFEDAGVIDYVIDESLKSILIFNPIPRVEHREALKMIANATCSTLFEDRDGNICIKKESGCSFIKDAKFYGATDYSLTSSLLIDNSANNYADAEINYTKADGSLLFLPEDTNYVPVGFVSSQIANGSGLFTNNPHIDLTLASEFEMRKMYLEFGVIAPTSVTITCKLAGVDVNTQTLTNPSLREVYEYDGMVDMITISFNGALPNQRIHLNNVQLNGKIGYELTYHEFKDTPVASTLERVTKVHVIYLELKEEQLDVGAKSSYVDITKTENEDGGETLDTIAKSSIYGSAVSTIDAKIEDNIIKFDTPYYNYKVTGGTIVESGAYYIIVNSDSEQEISIYAQPYSLTNRTVTLDIHEKGIEKTCENPLIHSEAMARTVANWLRDFYDDDIEYTFTYRGDPTLDADDRIYIENKFVEDNEIRITEESINTSTGMDFSCLIRARRTSFSVNATTDEGIMGDMRMGEMVME